VALYSLLGFLILPGVALRIANQQLAQYATVPAHLQRIELNPFSLELTLWGLQIGEPGKEQVGFERLYANLALDSLWTKPCTWRPSSWTNRAPSCCSPRTAAST
jgi:hypothetical protein